MGPVEEIHLIDVKHGRGSPLASSPGSTPGTPSLRAFSMSMVPHRVAIFRGPQRQVHHRTWRGSIGSVSPLSGPSRNFGALEIGVVVELL